MGRPAPADTTLRVTDLRTEYLATPFGTDVSRPRLSWRLASTRRNTVQTAYEVAVSTDSMGLLAGRSLLWSSGRVPSDLSVFANYGGPALRSATRYFWRVRVWDAGGASDWSAPSWWETGLLRGSDWSARWIRPPDAHRDSAGGPAPMLRRTFALTRPVRSARLYVTSLGLYEVELNGHRVGADAFAPGWTSYGKRLQYQTYDVTGLLAEGGNAIGATLGDGWYRGHLGFNDRQNLYGRRVALLLQLEVRYADGRTERIVSDTDWKAATGPILMSDIYGGETYDARRERPGWTTVAYDDSGWDRVALGDTPPAALIAPVAEPVRRTAEITPVAILHTPAGQTAFDLGQNITGWVRLRVSGAAGTTIVLRHAEVLDKDGNVYYGNLRNAAQTDRYTLKGGAEEIYEPHFTYHGFRYVSVEGLSAPPTLETITGIVVHSDLPETGRFATSDTMLNRLQHNIVWGQRGNFLDVPTDCPQRDERLGWTGDAQVFARTAAFNMFVPGFFSKWLADLAADQHPGGSVPWVIPNPLGGDSTAYAGAAGWADAAVVVPWTMYLVYGDRRLLERQYPSMRAWVDYASRQAGPGLVWRSNRYFGDWLAWHSDDASYPGATTGKDFIATAYLAHSTDLVARAAAALGRTADARAYAAKFAALRDAFRREFVSPGGRVAENTQTAYALAINFGLLRPADLASAARRLAGDIRAHDGHLSTGFLGTPELTRALSSHGHLDDAYRLLLQRGYPSWLYPITRGATTMWERWDGIRPDSSFEEPSMNSFNHYAFGAVGDWMYRVIGGIDIDPAAPGYKHALIAPRPGGGLTSASTAIETLYGTLATAWQLDSLGYTLDVDVPANTSARVTLWDATAGQTRESGRPPAGMTGVRSSHEQGNDLVLEIGSGHYSFRVAR
jgi:alpha-L-rhamnosidase